MRLGLAVLAAVALLAGCEQPRTELVVRVDSEVAWGPMATVRAVTVTVRRGGPTGPLRSARTTALGAGSDRRPLPLTVGILPGDDLDTPVWIEALGCADPNGCDSAGAVVAQRAVVRFTRGQTQEVALLLASACVGAMCGSDERCGEGGRCEPATRATVRPFDGADAGAVVDGPVADRVVADASDVTVAEVPPTDIGRGRPSLDVAAPDAPSTCGPLEFSCDGACRRLLTDVAHCGSCGNACSAGMVCQGGSCAFVRCVPGAMPPDAGRWRNWTACPGGCVDMENDASNCGGCGRVCPGTLPNTASVECHGGSCTPNRCAPNFGDCDGSGPNGCEVDLTSSDLHCGACGTRCRAPARCRVGLCTDDRCPAGMLYITGSLFTMGSEVVEIARPPHPVRVSDFCMDRTEVTVARYRACVAAGACSAPLNVLASTWFATGQDDYPVNGPTASQAGAFCGWAGGQLPTEAQWEYAARGTDGRAYPWGDDVGSASVCWTPSPRDGAMPCPAGSSRDDVSPFGVLDLGGNVMEWTRDNFGPYPSADAGVLVDPVGTSDPARRVVRGGQFRGGHPINLRADDRRPMSPSVSESLVGFRCVRAP